MRGFNIRAAILLAGLLAVLAEGHWEAGGTLAEDLEQMRSTGFLMVNFVVGCGGGLIASTNFRIQGTLGQPQSGRIAGGGYRMDIGFWQIGEYRLYLPIVRK